MRRERECCMGGGKSRCDDVDDDGRARLNGDGCEVEKEDFKVEK